MCWDLREIFISLHENKIYGTEICEGTNARALTISAFRFRKFTVIIFGEGKNHAFTQKNAVRTDSAGAAEVKPMHSW
jgi:hypothetical protein